MINGNGSLFPSELKKLVNLTYLHFFSVPSLANPKSVSLRTASFPVVVKSKFSGFKSPIISKEYFQLSIEITHDEPK